MKKSSLMEERKAAMLTHNLKTVEKKAQLIFFALGILALLLGACASAAGPDTEQDAVAPSAPPAAGLDQNAGREAVSEPGTFTSSAVQLQKRIVIKNANLSIVVEDPAKSMDAITQMADEMEGFVVAANLYQSRLESGIEVPRASITIRVPAERLNEAIARIRAETDRPVISENIESQDVTSDYTDLQSRLRNLENTEAKLAEIMDDANRTQDVLSVYNELVRVREQIEVIKGQIQYYDQASSLSAISVELLANEAVQPLTIGGWQPVGVAKNAVQALINTMKFIATAAIWIGIVFLPVLLVLYLVFFLPVSLLWRAWRRRLANKRLSAVPPTPPTPVSE